jgi:beta-alanine--pyruvate transaminase
VRVTGDTIALSPPLIISEAQIDEVVEKLGNAIAESSDALR